MKKNGHRIFHPWWKWECYKAGFYSTLPPTGKTKEQCKFEYSQFLSDIELFTYAMEEVIEQWPNSCEQFLTNPNINKLAWLGQASMCIATGIPSTFKSGFFLLSQDHQKLANQAALDKLNEWQNSRLY